jgi:hypothetical protein
VLLLLVVEEEAAAAPAAARATMRAPTALPPPGVVGVMDSEDDETWRIGGAASASDCGRLRQRASEKTDGFAAGAEDVDADEEAAGVRRRE